MRKLEGDTKPKATPRPNVEIRLARIHILLAAPFLIPEETKLDPVIYRDGDFVVRLLQPAQSLWQAEGRREQFGLAQLLPTSKPRPSRVTFNGSNTTACDLLSLEVMEASEEDIDDAVDAAIRTANRWLRTYRVSLGEHSVRYVSRDRNNWRADLMYLRPGMEATKAYGAITIKMPPIPIITDEAWQGLASLGPDYEPQRWEELLTDAAGLLPDIGPAVVLAYTALEVRIGALADTLASTSGMDEEFWKWLKSRDYMAQFTTDEIVKKILLLWTGKSLSQEKGLWATFTELRKARNSFAHEGAARNLAGKLITVDVAYQLLHGARQVLEWLDELAPAAERRQAIRLADKQEISIAGGPITP